MSLSHPLRFTDNFHCAIWGGRNLADKLGKNLPPGDDYAESWEVVDHGADQSVVAFGPLEGKTLAELRAEDPAGLLGAKLAGADPPPSRFPLLFKFLDVQGLLSVQAHPDDARAAQLDPPDFGKTEAWVILDAAPGAKIYAGLKEGVTRKRLAEAVAAGETDTCLNPIQPSAGDCIFLPAGVCHAAGDGLLIAEIQQSSDTTYRLFDWNRVGADGRPRELQVEQALEAIDYDFGPVSPHVEKPLVKERRGTELVHCDKFTVNRYELSQWIALGGDDRFRILAVIEGAVSLVGDPAQRPLALGQTALLPAGAGKVTVVPQGDAVVLEMFAPPARTRAFRPSESNRRKAPRARGDRA